MVGLSKVAVAFHNVSHAVRDHKLLFTAMVALFILIPVPVVFLFMLFAGGNLPTYVGVGDFISLPLLFTDINIERKIELLLGEGLFYLGYLDPKGAAESPEPNTYVYYVFRIHNLLLQTPTAVLAGAYISLMKSLKKAEACEGNVKRVRRSGPLGFSGLLVDSWAKIHITFAPLGACPTCIAGNVATVSIVSLAGISAGMLFSNAAALLSYLVIGGLMLYMGSRRDLCGRIHQH
ncbi:MAG: hypothetical protein NZ919_00045 [Candidatus Caldarchaeum sp.]|nr:hypothetical protein [Candidatus Caldarchaeum sp.]